MIVTRPDVLYPHGQEIAERMSLAWRRAGRRLGIDLDRDTIVPGAEQSLGQHLAGIAAQGQKLAVSGLKPRKPCRPDHQICKWARGEMQRDRGVEILVELASRRRHRGGLPI